MMNGETGSFNIPNSSFCSKGEMKIEETSSFNILTLSLSSKGEMKNDE